LGGFLLGVSDFEFPSVLQHYWLGDRKGIQLMQDLPLTFKGSFLEKVEDENQGELGNAGFPGKWKLK